MSMCVCLGGGGLGGGSEYEDKDIEIIGRNSANNDV